LKLRITSVKNFSPEVRFETIYCTATSRFVGMCTPYISTQYIWNSQWPNVLSLIRRSSSELEPACLSFLVAYGMTAESYRYMMAPIHLESRNLSEVLLEADIQGLKGWSTGVLFVFDPRHSAEFCSSWRCWIEASTRKPDKDRIACSSWDKYWETAYNYIVTPISLTWLAAALMRLLTHCNTKKYSSRVNWYILHLLFYEIGNKTSHTDDERVGMNII